MKELTRRRFVELTGKGATMAALVASPPGWLPAARRQGDHELVRWSATALARAIRAGEYSSEEVVGACLGRIDRVNPELNAVVTRNERALDQARAADRALAAGEVAGPLHGVPMTVKDSHDLAGVISTAGTQGRAEYVPERSATAVERLQAAGAVVIGKTNTPELTLSFETDNLLFGPTRNPYDTRRSPGGSSGGAAAIIAAAGSPLDLGTDTGGSIRLPSHFCGIAGIKPTSGRVPRTGHVISFEGLHQSMTQIGPMARKVEDLVLTLPLISGPDGVDPHVVPMPLGNPDAVDLGGLRVAWHPDNGIATPIDEIMTAVEAAARSLGPLAARVSEGTPPGLREYDEASDAIWMGDGGGWARRILEAAGTTRLSPEMEASLASAPEVPAAELTRLLEVRDRFRSRALAFWRDHDVLVSPVNADVAMLPGEWIGRISAFSYTYLYNDLGWPGGVVRCGTSREGLPIGVQVIAAPWREDVCLAVMRHLENELGGWQPVPAG